MRTVPAEMAAIDMSAAGGPEVLAAVRRPVPQPASGEVLIQRRGSRRQRSRHHAAQGPLSGAARRLRSARPRGLRRDRRGRRRASSAGPWATRSRRSPTAAATPNTAPSDARHCLPVPNGVSADRRGRAARDLLHGVEQHLHRRRPQGRRDAPRARRRRRHRHDGDPARQGVRRQGHRHRQPGGALRHLPRSRRRPRRRLQAPRISSRSCARRAART